MTATGPTTTGPVRLHHNAYITEDQEATRRFYEDVIGVPLVATWAETDELFGAERTYCHTFYALADGSALAFFQFASPEDRDLFKTTMEPSPFRHIALSVDQASQDAIKARAEAAEVGCYVLDHGYCVSLYVSDPNELLLEFTVDHADVEAINATRRATAHEDLARWLAGDHTSNNTFR